jgi:hypothetical protein
MKNSEFKDFLFKSAVIAMACDGNIAEEEIAEIKNIVSNEIYFMGYDLIESGDFFPLSRVKGNFIDDVDYNEFLGIGRGKRRRKGEAKKAEEKFPDLTEEATCQEIVNRILEVQTEMDTQRGKITAGDKSKWFRMSLGKLEAKLQQAKKLLTQKNCQRIAEEQELKTQQQDILTTLASTSVQTGASGGKKETIAGMNKYLVYGIGGFFVLGALFILLKPSKA